MSEKISNFLLKEAADYAKKHQKQEVCGVICEKDGVDYFLKCENIANDTEKSFAVDCGVFLDHEVKIVFHSHCLGSAFPSAADVSSSNFLDTPFLIYSTIDDNFCLYQNKSVLKIKV